MREKFRADFHLHIYTSWIDPFYEAGPRDLKTFTEQFNKRGLNAATLTSFNDNRFDRLMDTSKNLPMDWSIKDSDLGAIVTMPNGEKFYWFNSDEKPTLQGHFLIVGNKRETPHIKPYRNLEETLKEAKQNSAMLIADHPMMLLSDFRSTGIGGKNLRTYKNYFTAGEINGNAIPLLFFKANENTKKICNEIGLPLVANSDAYGITCPLIRIPSSLIFSNIGKTYTEFNGKNLNASSIESLLRSFKSEIEQNNVNPILRKDYGNNTFSIGYHALIGCFYTKAKKLSFLKIHHHGGIVE